MRMIIIALSATAVAVLFGLFSFLGIQTEKPINTNTDPHVGPVFFDDTNKNVYKVCDGTTLVYVIDHGGSAVANSPECRKKK